MDISNIPNFSDWLKDFGYKAGYAIDSRFGAMQTALTQRIDHEVAALTGQDQQFNQLIANLLKITDAQPGSPEWDEGQNLYTLLTNNYVALGERLTTTENKVAALEAWKSTMLLDYNNTINAIQNRIDAEIVARQNEITRIEGLLATHGTKITENANDITALKNRATDIEGEIAQLKFKRDDFETRLTTIEGKMSGMVMGNAFPEFLAGLRGEASPSGIAAPVLN